MKQPKNNPTTKVLLINLYYERLIHWMADHENNIQTDEFILDSDEVIWVILTKSYDICAHFAQGSSSRRTLSCYIQREKTQQFLWFASCSMQYMRMCQTASKKWHAPDLVSPQNPMTYDEYSHFLFVLARRYKNLSGWWSTHDEWLVKQPWWAADGAITVGSREHNPNWYQEDTKVSRAGSRGVGADGATRMSSWWS